MITVEQMESMFFAPGAAAMYSAAFLSGFHAESVAQAGGQWRELHARPPMPSAEHDAWCYGRAEARRTFDALRELTIEPGAPVVDFFVTPRRSSPAFAIGGAPC